MSRNSTWYTISRWSSSNVIDRDLLFYRTARTAKKARSIAANNPGAKILMERHTPSSFKWLHDIIPDNSKKMRQLRRLYRNFRRREADARKREERRNGNIFTPALRCHYTRNMGVRQFFRYLIGVRKGTIL